MKIKSKIICNSDDGDDGNDSDEDIENTISKSNKINSKDFTSYKDAGNYYLYGAIDEFTIKPVIEWIFDENLRRKHNELNIIITSVGGYTHDCFALIDTIEGSSIPVNTLGIGLVASSGLLIFLAGEKRTLTRNTQILSHQWSGMKMGKSHELLASRKSEDWLSEKMINYYIYRTKLSRKKIEKMLLPESDVFLSAEESLKLGICTEIKGRDWASAAFKRKNAN